jgi:LAS seventeen-binding protein 5
VSPPPQPPRPVQTTSPTRQSHKKTKSRDEYKSKSSYKPINFEKERHLILQAIAASQQSATNLTNALKRLNRETQHPEDIPQIQQLYRQCRKLRKDILIYIQRTESEEWIGTLINANEELVQSLARYEAALKPIEQDSDSDAWSVSDSDEEHPKRTVSPQKKMSTGGSGRSTVAEDLAQRLRAASLSQEKPPPKPPRPVVEIPPAKPPRPIQKPVPKPKPLSMQKPMTKKPLANIHARFSILYNF